jgi:uncharacterized membrane protein
MLGLYFGNVANLLSTLLFVAFIIYFYRIINAPESEKKWKRATIILIFVGILMSALSGIKDSISDTTVVSFEVVNINLVLLCGLGGLATLLGIIACVWRNEKVNKTIFYTLSVIIIIKTCIVEVLRIMSLFIA